MLFRLKYMPRQVHNSLNLPDGVWNELCNEELMLYNEWVADWMEFLR